MEVVFLKVTVFTLVGKGMHYWRLNPGAGRTGDIMMLNVPTSQKGGSTVLCYMSRLFFILSLVLVSIRVVAESGFLTTGLFRYSRHPNFFCEQAMWWVYYVFSVAAGAGVLNWTIAGAASLTLLFQGSTWITEKITLRKYPAYARYQKTTSRLSMGSRSLASSR